MAKRNHQLSFINCRNNLLYVVKGGIEADRVNEDEAEIKAQALLRRGDMGLGV